MGACTCVHACMRACVCVCVCGGGGGVVSDTSKILSDLLQ